MSILVQLEDMGVTVHLAENGKLKVRGRGHNNDVVEYIRTHKQAIVEALSNRTELPQSECPLVHGGFAPPECRYTHKVLIRMIETGTLPDPCTGCPLRRVCPLGDQLSEFDDGLSSADQELSSLNELSDYADKRSFCLGVHCERAGYRQHGGIECKWCGEVNQAVIDLTGCPSGHWHRDRHGMPVLG